MRISIHQPEHAPWLGFFRKMAECDLFVILDSVQYEKNYFQNRNRIRSNTSETGWSWITVPVLKQGRSRQLIRDAQISISAPRWRMKLWSTIEQNYSKAPYFQLYARTIRSTYTDAESGLLMDLNLKLIHVFREALGITTPLVLSSELPVSGARSELLLNICQTLGATTYVSGPIGRTYLDERIFEQAKIEVHYHDFQHPEYSQMHEPFISAMSAMDLLFNHGEAGRDILMGSSEN
jgi:hypothetical protein